MKKKWQNPNKKVEHFIIDDDSKKSLKIAVTEFYQFISKKCKEYTFKNFKNGGCHRATIY